MAGRWHRREGGWGRRLARRTWWTATTALAASVILAAALGFYAGSGGGALVHVAVAGGPGHMSSVSWGLGITADGVAVVECAQSNYLPGEPPPPGQRGWSVWPRRGISAAAWKRPAGARVVQLGRASAGSWTSRFVSGNVRHQMYWLHVPLLASATVLCVTCMVALVRWQTLCRHHAAGHCRSCGYDLRATPGRCPECGAVPA